MQLRFLAPVELFFKQLKGCSFWPGWNYYYLWYTVFPAAQFVMSTLCYQAGDVQLLWREKYFYIFTYAHTHTLTRTHTYTNTCTYTCACVFFLLLCGVMSCAARRWVVGWLGVVWCCRHVVVVVVFVLVPWSLSLRRHRKIERRRKSKKEMARMSLNNSSEECPVLLRMISTLQRASAERSMIEQKMGKIKRFPSGLELNIFSGKANGWRNRERSVFDLFSNSKWVRSSGYFWWTSEARDNPSWANFGKPKIGDKRWPKHPVKMLKNVKNTCFTDENTHPCVHSKHLRVYVQNVPVYTGTTRTCFNTCARGVDMHGDVLNVHTGMFWMDTRCFFGVSHHRPHRPHRPHTHHRHHIHSHTQHTTTTRPQHLTKT